MNFQLVQSNNIGVLEKLSYVDTNSRLKTILALNDLLKSINSTLNNTFPKNALYLERVSNVYISKLSNIGKIGPDMQKCITEVDKIYRQSPFIYDKTKMELQHDFEKEHIYRRIFTNIYEEARQKTSTMASEVVKFGIANDCEEDIDCRLRIEVKISEVENQYENILETTRALFMEQENNYRERIQDYRSILEKAMKPYNLLADLCLQKHMRNKIDVYSQSNLIS